MQDLSISFVLDFQENLYTEVPQTHYMSASEGGRHVVSFLDCFINDFLEVQNTEYS